MERDGKKVFKKGQKKWRREGMERKKREKMKRDERRKSMRGGKEKEGMKAGKWFQVYLGKASDEEDPSFKNMPYGRNLEGQPKSISEIFFLGLQFLCFSSVTSALTCHQFTNYTQAGLPGYFGVFSALNSNPSNRTAVKCLSSHNACVTIRLELSTVSHALFMDHRDCATTKYPNGGKESSKTNDKYFAIKYKATYCSSDLCNGEMPSVHAHNETTLVKEKCKPSSSKKCYAGINFHESETGLEAVICRSGSDYCYQGSGHIKAANNALHLYVRSCQSICRIPQQQIFGPIEISLRGSCCSGNLCNKKENADPTPTAQAWETTSELYGHSTVNQTGNFTNLGHGYGLFRDFECEDYIVDNGTEWSFIDPGAQGAESPFTDHGAQGPASSFIDHGAQRSPKNKGSTLQLKPLLLTLVVTVLALS